MKSEWGGGCPLKGVGLCWKNPDWWNTLATFHMFFNLPNLSQREAFIPNFYKPHFICVLTIWKMETQTLEGILNHTPMSMNSWKYKIQVILVRKGGGGFIPSKSLKRAHLDGQEIELSVGIHRDTLGHLVIYSSRGNRK